MQDTNNSTVDKTVLVHVHFNEPNFDEDIMEFEQLAASAGCDIVTILKSSRAAPDRKTFIGKGKAEEIQQTVVAMGATLVILNHSLSPSQVRNLEGIFKCRVIDRTDLILDIFAARARTYEGKLQVELAQLQHLVSRLVRGWTHLERQKGGIGLRGPGETQLETDRRLVRNRIKTIKRRLEKVRSQRQQNRHARAKANILSIAIVGYTNAGKSSLFNALTQESIYVQDQLFATLDPTLRQLNVPELGQVILADTVGFIRHLPHDLVEAFRATLEETRDADLLLHVVDASDPQKQEKITQVEEVLAQIEADNVPQLLVYNKIDQLAQVQPRIDEKAPGEPRAVWVSAVKQQGLDELLEAIKRCLAGEVIEQEIKLTPSQGAVRDRLYKTGLILSEDVDEQGNYLLTMRCSKPVLDRLLSQA